MKNWLEESGERVVAEAMRRVEGYDDFLNTSGIMAELRDSFKTFFGTSVVESAGSAGQLQKMRVNHYASLIRNLVALVTNNKPAWQPVSSNTDVESQASAILAAGLLDFYMKDRHLERLFRRAVTEACYLREGWVSGLWDTTMGEVVAVDESGLPIKEGDLVYSTHTLVDVIRDYERKDGNHQWLILRRFKNKHDIAAQFPEKHDKIMGAKMDDERFSRLLSVDRWTENQTDEVPIYTLFVLPTPSVPQGRMVEFVADVLLTDGPLPYKSIPLRRVAAEDVPDTPFGHSPLFDVLPVQKGLDTLASILLTNNATFGVQNVQYPIGSSLNVSQIGEGLNAIAYDPKLGKIEPLQLVASASESYKFFDLLVQQSQLLSGVNDAIRGQASAGQSGASLALLAQQAIQFANGLQAGYISLVEDIGTLTIEILQRYANTDRVAVLTGKNNRPLLKHWRGSDLMPVNRITVETGNALSKTTSGRLTMADSLMQAGMIKRPEQYIAVLTTGQLEPIYEAEQKQLHLIRSENEALTEGRPVRALLTDDHAAHVLEHAAVLSNPDFRADPNSPMVAATLAHVQEHLDLAMQLPPQLAAMLKQQSFMAPSMPPPGGPGEAPAEVNDPQNSITTESGEVNQPNLPTNPLTGEQVEPIA